MFPLKNKLVVILIAGILAGLIQNGLARERSTWFVRDGWAYRNNEKFFALGVWGIPGYKSKSFREDTDARNQEKFLHAAELFNLVYTRFGQEQDYMRNSLLFVGWDYLRWKFLGGFEGDPAYLPDRNKSGELEYEEMQLIKDNVNSYYYNYLRSSVVNDITKRFRSHDFIWFLVDEPNNGFKGWAWPPTLLAAYNNAVKQSVDSTLTYIDLFGTIRGDKISYEINYARKFGELPTSLPVGTNYYFMEGDPANLNTYKYTADGYPLFFYDSSGEEWLELPVKKFRSKYYFNVYQAALLYGNTADVIGVNCYSDFFAFPDAAATVVDAIKAAVGKEKPVWLFFDGAAIKKPASMTNGEYIQLLNCQVYTSLVHGASGALFWAQEQTDSSFWVLVEELAAELAANENLFKLNALRRGSEKGIHYEIKTNGADRVIIAVNTNKALSVNLTSIPDIGVDRELAPLDVAIIR